MVENKGNEVKRNGKTEANMAINMSINANHVIMPPDVNRAIITPPDVNRAIITPPDVNHTIIMPPDVNHIITALEQHGHEAYAVGGCVRDSLLSREPEDWDITTSATPLEIKRIFPQTVDTGIVHGTVTVIYGKEGYEVTTYRIDGEYEDGRHPKLVKYARSLTEDLKRRDFTINAMAYNDKAGLVDQFGGASDLMRGIIRCVGSAKERFNEDALRMLRAIRFSAQLGFEIEGGTKQAIIENHRNMSKVSVERIHVELDKLLSSRHPERLIIAYETGIIGIVLPEVDDVAQINDAVRIIRYLEDNLAGYHSLDVKYKKAAIWTSLIYCLKEPRNVGILRRLKFDNKTAHMVKRLLRGIDIDYHGIEHGPTPDGTRLVASRVGADVMEMLFMLQEAVIMCLFDGSALARDGKYKTLMTIKNIYKGIIQRNECFQLKDLAVDGGDLIGIGYKQGREIGELLEGLLGHVIIHPSDNDKEKLLGILPSLTRRNFE